MRSKFTTGQSTKECMNCHKLTRDTGRGERHTDFCWACMHAMELENEHSDDGHEEFDPECPTCQEESKIHTYIVDLDERGIFKAHVEDFKGEEVFSISSEEEDEGIIWLIDCGYMKNTKDFEGLEKYLKEVKILDPEDTIK